MPRVAKEKPFAPPKSIGECADLLYTLRAERLALNKQADLLEAKERLIRDHIINTLPVTETGVKGKVAGVTVVTKVVPRVEDWPALYAYIKKTGDFSLLQRRLGEEAVKERWENKKEVPGVGTFQTKTVSLTKV